MQAGLCPLWAIEPNASIARVYATNTGRRVIASPVESFDPSRLPRVDTLWVSLPSVRVSPSFVGAAARKAREGALTDATLRFISALRPRYCFLESAVFYRTTGAFRRVMDTLFSLGYLVSPQVVDAADFGVPQTRTRLLLLACLSGLVPVLSGEPAAPTGWFSAVADTRSEWLPYTPDSSLWRILETMESQHRFDPDAPSLLGGPFHRHLSQRDYDRVTARSASRPSFALRAAPDRSRLLAYLPPSSFFELPVSAMGRLQTLPTTYQYPRSHSLARRVVCNAVPCRLAERVLRFVT